ncbi:MAG TPA: hypothetical protein ACFYEK_17065 [Candidatus Wunengus sp. YC60]|uniref:hypothetical protein n=1 Tax=Candidatus Wunengus sp. YC60 TaxID=3367697 RepID=UPI0040267695
MKRIILLSVLFLSVVSIFGCGLMRNNILIPEQLKHEDKIAEDLEKDYLTMGTGSKVAVYTGDLEKAIKDNKLEEEKTKLKLQRNEIIGKLILLMNIRYSQYERAFYNTGASVGSAFDITTLAVTATGAVAGGAATKSILSAIAAGLTGSRLALEKNFLYEKTSPVLIAKMRKLREDKFKEIKDGMNKEIVAKKEKGEDGKEKVIEGYSLEQGLIDVQDYFYKGTVIGALQAMSEEIGKPTTVDIIKQYNELKDSLQPPKQKNQPEKNNDAEGSEKKPQ